MKLLVLSAIEIESCVEHDELRKQMRLALEFFSQKKADNFPRKVFDLNPELKLGFMPAHSMAQKIPDAPAPIMMTSFLRGSSCRGECMDDTIYGALFFSVGPGALSGMRFAAIAAWSASSCFKEIRNGSGW